MSHMTVDRPLRTPNFVQVYSLSVELGVAGTRFEVTDIEGSAHGYIHYQHSEASPWSFTLRETEHPIYTYASAELALIALARAEEALSA
jgi:hypothetical protein